MRTKELPDLEHFVKVLQHAKTEIKKLEEMRDAAWEEILPHIDDNTESVTINGVPVLEFERRVETRIVADKVRATYSDFERVTETAQRTIKKVL